MKLIDLCKRPLPEIIRENQKRALERPEMRVGDIVDLTSTKLMEEKQ